ncbi:MAG: hypothetical protein U1U88_001302 [Lawsonella clevelandensis]
MPLRRTPSNSNAPGISPSIARRSASQRCPSTTSTSSSKRLQVARIARRIIGGVAVLLAGVGDACAMLARLGYLGKAVRPVCYGEDCNAHYANNLSTHCAANRAARRGVCTGTAHGSCIRAASHPG